MEGQRDERPDGRPQALMLLYNNVAELRQIRGGHSDCYLSTEATTALR
jgi:hypothetical protein